MESDMCEICISDQRNDFFFQKTASVKPVEKVFLVAERAVSLSLIALQGL